MKLTDKTAVKLLNKVRCYDLEEDIETYPEEELVGVSNMQILTDEVSWIVSCYYEGGHCLCEDREEALYILRETEYGKKNYIDGLLSGKPSFRYRASQIQWAKDTINKVNRLKRLLKKLQGMGYYGRWYNI